MDVFHPLLIAGLVVTEVAGPSSPPVLAGEAVDVLDRRINEIVQPAAHHPLHRVAPALIRNPS